MAQDFDFSGIWHSVYHYTSTSIAGEHTSEYDLKAYRAGNQIVMQSLPNQEKAYILLRLTLDGRLLTGTWHEQTSPTGPYKGVTYYGALQLVISEDGRSMKGKYVGFNRKMYVQSGDWELTLVDKGTEDK